MLRINRRVVTALLLLSIAYANYTCSLRVHQNVAGLMKGTSDPFAVVTQLNTSDVGRGQAVVMGKTEV